MIEEVKKILKPLFREGEWKLRDMYAKEIHKLFLPYQDAQWSDVQGECFWCKAPTHWVDICYYDYVCSAKCQREIAEDVKAKNQLFPEEVRSVSSKLETRMDYIEPTLKEAEPKRETDYNIGDKGMTSGNVSYGFEPKPDRLLILNELLDYHKRKYAHMYQGNDLFWCTQQQDRLTATFNNHFTKLNREAQRDLTASIIRAECKAEIERLFEEIKKLVEGK